MVTAETEVDAPLERIGKTMVHTVLGKRPVSFTAKDGKEVKGVSLYLGYEAEGVEGMATDKVFISTTKLPKNDIVVGSAVDVRYTKYGKVEAIIND